MKSHIEKQLLARIHTFCQKHGYELHAIYGYGSAFNGQFRDGSDVDIAIRLDRPLDALLRFELMNALANEVKRDVDVVDMHLVDLEMQHIVLCSGQRLFVGEGQLEAIEDYEHNVYVNYITMNEERTEILNEIQKTGEFYGPDYSP